MAKPQDDIRARAVSRAQQEQAARDQATRTARTSVRPPDRAGVPPTQVAVTQPGISGGVTAMAGVDLKNPPKAPLEPATQPDQPEPIRPRVMPNPPFVGENNIGPSAGTVSSDAARFAVQPDPRQPAPDVTDAPPQDPNELTGRPNPYTRNADGSLRYPERHTSGPLAGQPVKPGETPNEDPRTSAPNDPRTTDPKVTTPQGSGENK